MRLNNDQLIDLLKTQKTSLSGGDFNKYCGRAARLLDQAGAKYRHMRDIEAGETAYQHIISAASSAISDACIDASEIDLVIYCGVGKGLIEPSNAYYYASELGMYTAECFDVADACMSWVRSMELAKLYLESSKAAKVMILTGEFHLNIRSPDQINDLDSLRYNFPAYTIGEAATATILEASSDPWDFQYVSRPEHFDLCTIPLHGYESYIRANDKVGINGVGKFASFGKELFEHATPLLQELLNSKGPKQEDVDLYIPHAPSKTAYLEGAKRLGIPSSKVFLKIFEEFGNIVSSSLPAAINQAKKIGLISEGSRLCLTPASAGISCACVTFTL
jgi:3-oxoacyl-[acyl-carrier-protein] synthase III